MELSSIHIGWTEILLAFALVTLYAYYSWSYSYAYWKRRNVPYLKPRFPFGNVADVFLLKKNFRDSWLELYNRLDDNPFGGVFSLKSPVLIIRDPQLIKLMLTKDFSYFLDRGFVPKIDHEPLLNNIAFMEGEVWRQMRIKLSPTFTSGKLKMMFSLLNKCSSDLESCLKNIVQNKGSFEAKDLMTRYTFDTIVTCFFGLKATAVNDPDCELYKTSETFFVKSVWRLISNIMFVEAPNWYSRLGMHIFQYDACRSFAKIIKEAVEFREKQNITKIDFLDMLIKIKNNISIDDKEENCAVNNNVTPEKAGDTGKGEDKNKLTVEDVMSQILGFFIAGFETSSSGLSFCLYELGRNPDVQIKMQRELDEAYERHGVVNYQMLQELTYIDNVISETLRMYSTLAVLNRLCVKPYKIPGTDVVVEKGCRVIIPTYGIHHDPKYYPEPFKFDPDRFLVENVKSRPAYTFLPFGEGPRMCIGMRFAKVQMKMALVALFSKFNVRLNSKSPVPLSIAYGEFLTKPRDEILVDLYERNDFLPATSMNNTNDQPVVKRLENEIIEQTNVGPLQNKTIGRLDVEPLVNKTIDKITDKSLENKAVKQHIIAPLSNKKIEQHIDRSLVNKSVDECLTSPLNDRPNEQLVSASLDNKLIEKPLDNETKYESVVGFLDNERKIARSDDKTNDQSIVDCLDDRRVYVKTSYQPVVGFIDNESNNDRTVAETNNDANNTTTIRQTIIYNKIHIRREILR